METFFFLTFSSLSGDHRLSFLDFGLSHKLLPSDSSMKRSHRDRFRFTSECKDLQKLKEIARYLEKHLSSKSSKVREIVEALYRASSHKDLVRILSHRRFANLKTRKIPLQMHAIVKKMSSKGVKIASLPLDSGNSSNFMGGDIEANEVYFSTDDMDLSEESIDEHQLTSSTSSTTFSTSSNMSSLAPLLGWGPEILPYREDNFVNEMELPQMVLQKVDLTDNAEKDDAKGLEINTDEHHPKESISPDEFE